ncbi:hypothetical protein [Bacillus sp. FJAT-27251]|uniref:hypothetical protein n=1 Tax=Bacillus sp. FJAT-27251 TaxID=1684142 RepID=UPI000A54B0D6|nr:hypothetical protein [Bacillus sp. FJAT-27251]
MTKKDLTSDTVQPLMSTGTAEPGFKKENKENRLTDIPRIGQGIMGDDGITGKIR